VTTEKIQDKLESLSMRINTLADMQLLLMEEVGKRNPNFQMKVIAATLSYDEFREDFTEYVQTKENMPDKLKVFMQEINEMVKDIKEEE
jgi:hypothetical protein